MNPQLAIVCTAFLREYISGFLEEMDLEADFVIYTYETYPELQEVYKRIPESIGGIIASGFFPQQIMRKCFLDNHRIINAVNNDNADIFKLLLQLLCTNRDLDISRIQVDGFDILGMDIKEYLFSDQSAPYIDVLEGRLGQLSLEELIGTEERVLQKHLDLWRAGKIDLSITRFSSIIPRLKEEGIPVYFPFFTRDSFREICRKTLDEMRIVQLDANKLAVVMITVKPGAPDPQLARERLYQAVKKYIGSHQLECIIHHRAGGIELLTNRKSVLEMTREFQQSDLEEYLTRKICTDVAVGYGLGDGIHEARIHAIDANHEAAFLPGAASCLVNEKNEMIAPLGKGEQLVVTRGITSSLQQAAKETGLSYLSLQKVAAAADDREDRSMTSRELALKLSVSKRTANRFLSALTRAGRARVVETRKGTTKGRPERVYRIDLEHLDGG